MTTDAEHRAKLQSWLDEAESALHKLTLGDKEVEISYEDQGSMKYTQANVSSLRAYVAELRMKLNPSSGRRTHRVVFG